MIEYIIKMTTNTMPPRGIKFYELSKNFPHTRPEAKPRVSGAACAIVVLCHLLSLTEPRDGHHLFTDEDLSIMSSEGMLKTFWRKPKCLLFVPIHSTRVTIENVHRRAEEPSLVHWDGLESHTLSNHVQRYVEEHTLWDKDAIRVPHAPHFIQVRYTSKNPKMDYPTLRKLSF